jgi:hypothetical protein
MHPGRQETDYDMSFVDLLSSLFRVIHIKSKGLTMGMTLDFIPGQFRFNIAYPDKPPIFSMIKQVFNQGGGGKTGPQD